MDAIVLHRINLNLKIEHMNIQHYLTTGEAVEFLSQELKQQVNYYDLDNLLRSNAIETPDKIAGRRVWTHDNLKEAARALRIRRAKRPVLTEERRSIEMEGQADE